MRRPMFPRLIPAVFGLVLMFGANASARCLHGLLHCGYCSKTVYSSRTTTTGPAANTGAIVALPSPGQANAAGVATPPPFSNTMAPVMNPVVMHPAYASPYYSQPSAAQAPASLLAGFNENAAIPAISPGTVLSNGQLFGSHILQHLRKFGAGLDKSGLLNLASKAFVDAAGFLPGNADVAILEKIVGMVLPQNKATLSGPGAAETNSNTQVTTLSDGTTVFRITVTVEVPPGFKVQTSTGQETPNDKPPGPRPSGTNDEGDAKPPAAPSPPDPAPAGDGKVDPAPKKQPASPSPTTPAAVAPAPKASSNGNQRVSFTARVSMQKP
jgi:hypothetical protein